MSSTETEVLVFSTTIYSSANDPGRAFGALELGLSEHLRKVFYRTTKGLIFDISHSATFTNPDQDTVKVVVPYDANSPAQVGIDIQLATATGANFSGTFTYSQDSQEVTNDCSGTFVTSRTLTADDLAVIQSGPQPIPENLDPFLSISPWHTDDSGQSIDDLTPLGQRLVNDIFVRGLPAEAKTFRYSNPEDPTSLVSLVPGLVLQLDEKIQQLVDLQLVQTQNADFIKVGAIYVMVRDMKAQNWLDPQQNAYLIDASKPFFEMLSLAGNDVTADPDYTKLLADMSGYANILDSPWGQSLLKQREQALFGDNLPSYVSSYRDLLRRSFLSAYVELRSDWTQYLKDPETSYNNITAYLVSSEYKQHWLPTLIDTVDNKFTVPLQDRLEALGDKLKLLQTAAATMTGNQMSESDVDTIIDTLEAEANITGLMTGSLMDFSNATFESRAYTPPDFSVFGFLQALSEVEAFQLAETYAKPLGLFIYDQANALQSKLDAFGNSFGGLGGLQGLGIP